MISILERLLEAQALSFLEIPLDNLSHVMQLHHSILCIVGFSLLLLPKSSKELLKFCF